MLVLGTFVVARGKWTQPASAECANARLVLLLSGLATGASWLCYFRALKLGPASKVAPIDKLSVVLVALFAVLFLGERPAPRDWRRHRTGCRRRGGAGFEILIAD